MNKNKDMNNMNMLYYEFIFLQELILMMSSILLYFLNIQASNNPCIIRRIWKNEAVNLLQNTNVTEKKEEYKL